MAIEDMEAHQIDVNNAFTESALRDTIYMHLPEGLEVPEGQVLLVVKSLYGLKQSAFEWNDRCDKALKSLGFKRCESDPCVYIRIVDGVIVGVYVDDLLILAPHGMISTIEQFKSDFRKLFKIKDLGPVSKILGMQILRDRSQRTVSINQSAYIEKFLHQFEMDQSKPKSTPMNGYEGLRATAQDDTPSDRRLYQTMIGKVMYAMIYTRPDICFAMLKLL